MFAKAQQPVPHRCRLLCEMSTGWQELEEPSLLVVSRSSLQVRSGSGGQLQADIPHDSITRLTQIGWTLLRVEAGGRKFALKMEGVQVREAMERLTAELRTHSHAVTVAPQAGRTSAVQSSPMQFPTAQDPALHQLVLELLFKHEFKQFVGEVKMVLEQLEGSITGVNE